MIGTIPRNPRAEKVDYIQSDNLAHASDLLDQARTHVTTMFEKVFSNERRCYLPLT